MMDKLPPGHYQNMMAAIDALGKSHQDLQSSVEAATEQVAKDRRERYHKMRSDHALIQAGTHSVKPV